MARISEQVSGRERFKEGLSWKMGNLILARAKSGFFFVVFKRDEALPVAGVCRKQRKKYREEWVALGQEEKSKMRPRPGSQAKCRSQTITQISVIYCLRENMGSKGN